MSQCNISCALHDYIEIACMYGYQVKLYLKNGHIIVGKAIDIHTDTGKHEYLIVDNEQQKIELSQLAKMNVLTPNAKFSEVVF